MKKKILTAVLLSSVMTIHTKAEVWTLDSCLNYAAEHNLQVRVSQASLLQGEIGVDQAKSGYLPNVSASAGQSWSLGRGLTSENTYANRNTSNFNWGVSLSLPLFDGLRTPRQVEYANASLNQIIEQYEAAKENISINVISAYLQVLYTQELLKVAQNQVALSEYELARRRSLLDAGKIPEIDMLEAESLLSSDRLSEVQAQNSYTMAKIDLARLLNIDEDVATFEVVPVKDKEVILAKPDELFDKARIYSHSVLATKKGIEVSDANIKLSESGYLPSLSFGSNIGSSYYRLSGFKSESFAQQMRHNYSTYFGFSLNVPIFDGFRTKNSIRRAKADRISAELRYDQVTDELRHTINEVYYQAVGSFRKYESSKEAEDYAFKAFDAVKEKYNLGRATSAEYEQSKTKSLRATSERIQACYELIMRSHLLDFYTSPH